MEFNNTTAALESSNVTQPGRELQKDYVGFVSVPLFLVLGVCGNLLTIVVMRAKPFSKFPSSYVLISLAVSDTVLNVLLPLNKIWVHQLFGTDIRSYTESGCQTFFWAFRTAKMTSSWFVVLICMERFVAVCLPLRAPVVCRKRYALLGIILIYVIIGVYNGVWVTFADRIVDGVCRPNTQPPGLVETNRTFLIVGLSIYSFIPCVILAVLTSLIIAQLYKARKMRMKMAIFNTETFEDPTAKTTRMLVCIIVAFVLLVLPIAFGHLIFFFKRKPIFVSQDPGVKIYREVATLLEHMNYSINFFLYVVACPSFRKHLPKCRLRRCVHRSGSQENLALQDSSSSDKTKSTSEAKRKGSESSLQIHKVSQPADP